MRKISTLSFTALFALFIFSTGLTAQESQEESNFNIQVETQFLVGQSFINQIGSEMETFSSEAIDQDARTIVQNYGFTEKPIMLNRDIEQSFSLQANYSLSPVEEGLFSGADLKFRISRISTSGSVEGMVESDRGALSGDGAMEWVKMFGANPFPVINLSHRSLLSPVSYHASDSFDTWNAGLSVEKTVVNLDGYRFSISGGLQMAQPDYTITIGQNQRARAPIAGTPLVLDNKITLETEGRSSALMLGPSAGLAFEKGFGSATFGFSLQQTIFYSRSNYTGEFIDIDDMTFTNTADADRSFTQYLDGKATFNQESSEWVTNTDIQLSAEWDAGLVDIGTGLSASLWQDMPLAPTFHNPWGLGSVSKAPTGVEWRVEGRDVSLTGVVLYVSTPIN